MKILNKLDNYINDKSYQLIYKDNSLNIINYKQIKDFNSYIIEIELTNNSIVIKGQNLVISKLMEDELLIIGNINSILFKKS